MATFYEKKMNDISLRKEKLNSFSEISLAIEDRFTNLRIWLGKKDGKIYIRLDKANNYSTPLSLDRINYLNNEHKAINKLLKFYVFGETEIDQIDKVLDITKNMDYRECIVW